MLFVRYGAIGENNLVLGLNNVNYFVNFAK
jgi:hypothetical protein